MSRWTKFRDKATKAVKSATIHPLTVVRTVGKVIKDPKHLGKKDEYGSSYLDIVGNPFSYDDTSRHAHQAVGAAIATYFGGTAVYSALGYGTASSAAVEVGIAGTDVGVAAGSAGSTGLISGGAAAGTAGGASLLSSSNLGTLGLVLAALKKGNVAGAVDAATGTDWGSAMFGGGTSGGSSGGFAPRDYGGSDGGTGGISPIFLVIAGIVLVTGLFFLVRKLHA